MNQIIEKLKSYELWSNTAYEYVLALLIFIGTIIVLKIFQSIVLSKLKKMAEKTKTEFDDVLIKIFREIKPPFYFFIALYFGIKVLEFPDIVSTVINILFLIIIVYEIIRAFEKIVDFGVKKYVEKADGKQVMSLSMIKALKIILKIILWAIGLILVLGNLGIDVTSLIAGLGIGGIAIALALQNILEDMFSSFSIYVDKPFRVGDYIVVGKDSGTVERIGLKTSRLRTLTGEELVISNKELTNARVQNFRKMESRRDSFTLGVVYDTPAEKLEQVPKIIEEIVSGFDDLEFVRCKFTEFGDSSLNFEIVYLVNSKEFDVFAEMKQKINFEIYKRFKRENIEFAYPTQTIFVNK
jgi:small-conductance mechanosensitive channel